MFDDLSKKMDIQNIELKNITKSFENISFIIQHTKDAKTLNELKNILQDLKTVLQNLGVNISELEVSISSAVNKDSSLENVSELSSTIPKIVDSNTLLISEVKNKVILPYKVSDLQNALTKNKKFKNLQDVIDNIYTIPLDKYKSSSVARFKEAYNLMRKKEKASVFDSLSLATEVTFNNLLNPAIITACQGLDELDIYLDCLASNELDKFDYFKIKYEILPKK